MTDFSNPPRYSIIGEKNKREIVMLRGQGCVWRRCRFCDYHLDQSTNTEENYTLNEAQLNKVTGLYKKLEVINSGSFTDLDAGTIRKIKSTCQEKQITQLHFECHWIHRNKVPHLKADFQSSGITVKIKTGVETFNSLFRESYLDKGITTDKPEEIAAYFDECCLLFGLPGQTVDSMLADINTGLEHFERICINIMQKNTTPIKPDPMVIKTFTKHIYPQYKDDPRIDILMENTDFGVGGKTNAQ